MATATPSKAAAGSGRSTAASTPLSPTRITRLQEKEELRHLNDRLAVYIDRVRSLELENEKLSVKVSEKEEVTTREVTGIKSLYEAELADARRVLDETARERARLQIDLGKVNSEFEELTKSCKKRDGDLALAQARIKDLESQFNQTEASLNTALSENAALSAEISGLMNELAKAQDAHAVAKKQLEAETLMRVDVENRCQSLSEELEFRKSMFEEEVRETRKRHEKRMVEVDSGAKQDYEYKLAQALQELRKEHEQQVNFYKAELEQTFQAKLENAKVSSDLNDKAVNTAREELQESRVRIEGLTYQLSALQKQAAAAEERVRELEDLLKLSPSPASRVTVSRSVAASSSSSRSSRAKRKRVDDEASSAPSFRVSQHAEATGSINIEELDLEGKSVTLKNVSNKDQSLGSWRLKRQVGEEDEIAYKFSPKFVLKAGQTVTVWAADAGVAHSPPSNLLWKSQNSWGSGDETVTLLINSDGEEVAKRVVTKSMIEMENGDDENDDFGNEDLFHQQGDPKRPRECAVM
ncbi:Lamin-L(II) [Bagarius yarrelli]|uniref:Lamin-L(II) n=1 Tax=Bagarius yarrelli TaxID=175774 RepID=A0A556TS72_BAGYA|nr:Lamin-L(II) [Bagarius yarrelli]